MISRTAVILFNLGGPDGLSAVRPFLANLFGDPAIIGLPQPFRWLLARYLAGRRAPVARAIYAEMGGASPLLENTEAQAAQLEAALGAGFKVFTVMRYWHPRAAAQVAAVRDWAPDRIVLLPGYPQFSGTTTGSSVAEWRRAARSGSLAARTTAVCCWPREPGFVAAMTRLVVAQVAALDRPYRVLLTAHGLPERVVAAGDPYQWQVEETARSLDAALAAALGGSAPELVVCYQSRVGPLRWIGPSTEDEISRAGSEGIGLVVVPVAFISEHSETLVELDIEYRHLAAQCGVPFYRRVATVGIEAAFIEGLAGIVKAALDSEAPVLCGDTGPCCPAKYAGCPLRK